MLMKASFDNFGKLYVNPFSISNNRGLSIERTKTLCLENMPGNTDWNKLPGMYTAYYPNDPTQFKATGFSKNLNSRSQSQNLMGLQHEHRIYFTNEEEAKLAEKVQKKVFKKEQWCVPGSTEMVYTAKIADALKADPGTFNSQDGCDLFTGLTRIMFKESIVETGHVCGDNDVKRIGDSSDLLAKYRGMGGFVDLYDKLAKALVEARLEEAKISKNIELSREETRRYEIEKHAEADERKNRSEFMMELIKMGKDPEFIKEMMDIRFGMSYVVKPTSSGESESDISDEFEKNHYQNFIKERISFVPKTAENRIPLIALYEEFDKWGKTNGLQDLAKTKNKDGNVEFKQNLKKDFARVFGEKAREVKSSGRFWEGIRFKNDTKTDQPENDQYATDMTDEHFFEKARDDLLVRDSNGLLDKTTYYTELLRWMRQNVPAEFKRRQEHDGKMKENLLKGIDISLLGRPLTWKQRRYTEQGIQKNGWKGWKLKRCTTTNIGNVY